ncbi:MAG: dCTP deaminase [Candidatus Marsarchaeota archaeon]|jgi:dCTP deaminase|nr:dCTP deaminase [Candidatus Marsarchaeota archaeon]
MSVLAKSNILTLIKTKKLVITPFDISQIGSGSIDLRLGDEFRIFKKHDGIIDVSENNKYQSISSIVKAEPDGIVLMPGQFINGITLEKITLPVNVSGRIEGRSRFARIGLLVHVSSGFVQPGSSGKVVLEIANLSKVKLRLIPGIRICQIILEEVKGAKKYSGAYSNQEHP